MDDWYNLTLEDINKHGGHTILRDYFNYSPSKALQGVYPEHNWMIWRFHTVPRGYWEMVMNDQCEQKRIIDWLGDQLSIKSVDDWYRISTSKIRKLVRLESSKTFLQMISTTYPAHNWDTHVLNSSTNNFSSKASQREVVVALRHLFPSHNIQEDFKHPEMEHSSGRSVELDVFVDELRLAVEYQGEQHYRPIYSLGGDFATQRTTDIEKYEACKKVPLISTIKIYLFTHIYSSTKLPWYKSLIGGTDPKILWRQQYRRLDLS